MSFSFERTIDFRGVFIAELQIRRGIEDFSKINFLIS